MLCICNRPSQNRRGIQLLCLKMLKNLHLVGENEEDDLYSEYKELDTEVIKCIRLKFELKC